MQGQPHSQDISFTCFGCALHSQIADFLQRFSGLQKLTRDKKFIIIYIQLKKIILYSLSVRGAVLSAVYIYIVVKRKKTPLCLNAFFVGVLLVATVKIWPTTTLPVWYPILIIHHWQLTAKTLQPQHFLVCLKRWRRHFLRWTNSNVHTTRFCAWLLQQHSMGT